MDDDLIQKHGGYKNLKSFQISQLIFDITVRFCKKFIDKNSRTYDQMVQAARSGVQNIAEGSQASGTSKRTEMKLTNVARSSLEELKLDYLDFLRQGNFAIWENFHPLGKEIIESRFTTATQFSLWVKNASLNGQGNVPEIAANGVLVLLHVACKLLSKQVKSQAETFKNEGGFTERLYNTRKQNYKPSIKSQNQHNLHNHSKLSNQPNKPSNQ